MYDEEYGEEEFHQTQMSEELDQDDRQKLGLIHKNLEM